MCRHIRRDLRNGLVNYPIIRKTSYHSSLFYRSPSYFLYLNPDEEMDDNLRDTHLTIVDCEFLQITFLLEIQPMIVDAESVFS